jgi:hypothetical protein
MKQGDPILTDFLLIGICPVLIWISHFLLLPSGFRNKLSCLIFGRTQNAFAASVTKTKTRWLKPFISTQGTPVFAHAVAHLF